RRVPKESIEARLGEQDVEDDEDHQRAEQPDGDARYEGAENVDVSEHPRPPATAAAPCGGSTVVVRTRRARRPAPRLPARLARRGRARAPDGAAHARPTRS